MKTRKKFIYETTFNDDKYIRQILIRGDLKTELQRNMELIKYESDQNF